MKKNYFLICLLLCCINFVNAQDYVPWSISEGYNHDVIANGTGAAALSTTATFDYSTDCLVSSDFKVNETDPPLGYGLPMNGLITADYDPDLKFQLMPYNGMNSMRLRYRNETGTFVFTTPKKANKLVFLAAGGNVIFPEHLTVVVHFSDQTTQSSGIFYIEDWHGGVNTYPTVIKGMGKVVRATDFASFESDKPKLYGLDFDIAPENQLKRITKVTFTYETNSGGIINLLAVTGLSFPDCDPPTDIHVSDMDVSEAAESSITLNWSVPTLVPAMEYEYEIRTSGLPGSGSVGLFRSGGMIDPDSRSIDIRGVFPDAVCYIYMRSKCSESLFSEWTVAYQIHTACAVPSITANDASICAPGPIQLNATTTSGTLKWYDSPTAITALAAGTSYTVPNLSSTRSYWVEGSSPAFLRGSSGKKTITAQERVLMSVINIGLVFDLTAAVYLRTVDLFVVSSGVIDIQIVNNLDVEVFSTGLINVEAIGQGEKVTIPLDAYLAAGTDYKIILKSNTTFFDISNNATYPYSDPQGILTVKRSHIPGGTPVQLFSYYWCFFNLVFEKECLSDRVEVVAAVTNTPAPTTLDDSPFICQNTSTELRDLQVNGTAIKWYDAAVDGNLLVETDVIAAATYYATQTVNGCESVDRLPITIEFGNLSTPITNTTVTYQYRDAAAALTATASTANSLLWYNSLSGVGQTQAYTPSTNAVGTQTYWVKEVSPDGCESGAVEITVVVNPMHLTVTADADQSKFFGINDPLFRYNVSGFAPGETNTTLSGALSRLPGESIGTYPIVKGTLSAGPNYTIDFVSEDFTINKAPITGITFTDNSFVYDGTVKFLAIVGTLPAGATDTYSNNGISEAGVYTVTATINGGVNYESTSKTAVLTITKAPVNISFNDKTVTYDGLAHSIPLLGIPPGVVVYFQNSYGIGAGIYTIVGDVNGGNNYENSTISAILTIEKATISGITFTDNSFVYDGTAKSLAIGGTLPTGAAVTYSNNDKIEVGAHTVIATINGGANYEDTTKTAVLTIDKAPVTGITLSDNSFVYDGTAKSLAIEGTLPAGAAVTYSNNDKTEAGVYTVTATINGGANYEDSTLSASLTINKAPVTGITFTDNSFVYDGTVKSLAIVGTLPTGAVVTYADNNQTAVGFYTVTATINGGTNYENTTLSAALMINKAPVTGITFTDNSFVYDGTAKALAIVGTLPAGATVTYSNNDKTEAGIYTVTATINGGANFENTTKTAVLTITKAVIAGVIFTDNSFVYDGTAKSLAIVGTLPAGATVTYSNNDKTEAGIHTVTATINGGANYENTTKTAVLTITKAPTTGITFSNNSFVYDGTAKSLAIVGTLPTGATVTYSNNDKTATGVYTVTATINGGANYENTTKTAVLTITKALIPGITFSNNSFVYDGTAKALAIVGTLPAGATVTYSNNDKTEAGVYTVTATINGGANYENTTKTAVLTITKALVSGITFSNNSFVYDGTAKALAIVGTLPAGATVTYSNNDKTEAGVYTVTATINGGTNYENTTKTAVLTITKAVIPGITFTDNTFTYDGTAKALAIVGTLPAGATVTYSNNDKIEAGIYTVTASINGGANYENITKTAVLTITKAVIPGITFTDNTFTYDGTAKSLAIVGILPTGATVTYADNNQIDAGVYTVTATINGGTNYENTTKTALLTIAKAVISGVTFSDNTFTYDGTTKALSAMGLPQGASVSYVNNDKTAVGVYTVTANINGGANYISTTKTAVLTIEKANLTAISFNGSSFVYNGSSRSLSISGNLPTGVTVTYANNGQTNVGIYTVSAHIDGGNNYNDLSLTATMIIEKAAITTVRLNSATIPYDGSAKSLLISGNLPAGTTVSYQNNGQINIGVYPIIATISGGNNYNDLVLNAVLTIEKGVLNNIYLQNATYRYDGTVKSLAISGNSLPAGVTVSYQNNDQITAGTYAVVATLDGGVNYHDRVLNAVLIISKAPIENVTFSDASFVYDGTIKALSIRGTLPVDAVVTYRNNANIVAGIYTVTANISGGQNHTDLQLTAKLTIEKAPQIINFETLGVITLEDAVDFQLTASVASGLALNYSYTFASTTAAAAVSESGWVTLNHPGKILITAQQPGDRNYLAATLVTRELQIESRDSNIHELWIGQQHYRMPEDAITYVMDCDMLDSKVSIKIQTQLGATIDPGQEFTVDVLKPGIYKRVIRITSENGKITKEYQVTIVKPFPFHYITEQKYNNVLLINNNPKTNGGFRFVKFEWYKNDQLIGEEQVYSAGNRAIDLLDPSAIYRAVLTTENGDVISVCPFNVEIKQKMGMKMYPNPVEYGNNITLTISDMQPEWKGEPFMIYDMNGRLLQQTVIDGVDTEIILSTSIQRGIYLAVFRIKGEQKLIKFVVK